MKNLKIVKETKVERPPRVVVSEKEALERIKKFAERQGRISCHC